MPGKLERAQAFNAALEIALKEARKLTYASGARAKFLYSDARNIRKGTGLLVDLCL
jgi:hypothetical protein